MRRFSRDAVQGYERERRGLLTLAPLAGRGWRAKRAG
jgi:hypothetical protein